MEQEQKPVPTLDFRLSGIGITRNDIGTVTQVNSTIAIATKQGDEVALVCADKKEADSVLDAINFHMRQTGFAKMADRIYGDADLGPSTKADPNKHQQGQGPTVRGW